MEPYDFRRHEDVIRWCHEFARRFPPSQSGHWSSAMRVDGYGASVMLAPRLEGDTMHGLPPGFAAPAYPVAPYEGCPSDWRRKNDAFFVPIPMDQDGRGPGMWYDWTMNDGHTHDIAVVPSTTGLNPITFQKADKLRLERYKDRCPLHDIEFEGERFCRRCNDGKGLQWPPQNYVAKPNVLWWDGFRRPDGTVRQFWFSDDVLKRDVGVAVLGADRVPAFGFAFFRSKEAKPVPVRSGPMRGAGPMIAYAQLEKGAGSPGFDGGMRSFGLAGGPMDGIDEGRSVRRLAGSLGAPPPAAVRRRSTGSLGHSQPAPTVAAARPVNEIRREAVERTVAVAAGSGIWQGLWPDPRMLDEWQPDPAAVITVYFVPEETAVAILQGPKRDLTGPREGALASIPVVLGTD